MGPHWIKQWIADLAALNDQFRDDNGVVDFEALGREEYQFRMALITRKFSKSYRAKETFAKAKAAYDASVENGKKGGRPSQKKEDQDELTADAATREGAEVAHSAGNGVITEPTTVCKNAEEGGTRKDPLNMTPVRKNDALESGTSSANLRGSARPSTDGDTRKDSLNITGSSNGASLESSTSVENLSGSGKPKNDQRRAGGISPLSSPSLSPSARSGSVDVLNLAYAGEFGNVRLTQEQYSELGIKFGNMQKLNRAIDSLSCMLENEEIKPVPKNHYAVLLKWASYRDDMEEKEELKAATLPHYETVSEHNARIVRESDAWIHEYCQQQKKNRKAANG